MATATGRRENVLRDNDAAYLSHESRIKKLETTASDLGILRKEFRKQMFTVDAQGRETGIICDRPRGDDGVSVSKLYFGAALRLLRDESGEGDRKTFPDELVEKREAIEEALALHLSVGEHQKGFALGASADETTERYRTAIGAFEDFCRKQEIPSLLPNLFLHSSLSAQLAEPAYAKLDEGRRGKLLERLAGLFQRQPYHLHTVIAPLFRGGKGADARMLMAKVAAWRKIPETQLYVENFPIAQECAAYLFEQGQHDAVIDLWRSVRPDNAERYPTFTEKYLRSLCGKGDFNETKECIETYTLRTNCEDRDLSIAVTLACENVAWWMHGGGKYEEGMLFLTMHASHQLSRPSSHARNAYDQMAEMQRKPKRKT